MLLVCTTPDGLLVTAHHFVSQSAIIIGIHRDIILATFLHAIACDVLRSIPDIERTINSASVTDFPE
jgi:hypothetical protein